MPYYCVPRIAYDTYQTPERLEGLIGFCLHIGAKEVMLVPSSASPEPVWLPRDALVERMRHTEGAVRALREKGIRTSVNILRVLCPGRTFGKNPIGFNQCLVTADGTERPETPCPLDENYLDYMRFFFARLGETGAPDFYIDDDFGHWLIQGGPGCFCSHHVEAFNRWNDGDVDRDALAAALNTVPPAKLTEAWAAFQAETLVQLASLMAKSLHGTDPKARLGLMLTSSRLAAYCGRTRDVVLALADGCKPLVRPGQGWYGDHDRLVILNGLADVVYQQTLLPEGTDMIAEIDSIPHCEWSKSRRMFFDYQVKANLACRLHRQSIWCFNNDEKVDETHRFAKPILAGDAVHQAMAAAIPEDAVREGVGVLYSERTRLIKPRRPTECGPESPVLLWRMGIPFTFEASPALILTRESFLAEIDDLDARLKGRNLFVDVEAARELCRLGKSGLIGVEVEDRLDGAEQLGEQLASHPVNGRFGGKRFRLSTAGPSWRLRTLSSAAVPVSAILDLQGEVSSPSAVIFETPDRRVAVLPYEFIPDRRIFSWHRKEQFRNIFAWLCGGVLPAYVDGAADLCPNVFRNPVTGARIAAMLNCSHDPAVDCDLYIAAPGGAESVVWYIDDRGQKREIPAASVRRENGSLIVRLDAETGVRPFDVRVFIAEP